MRVSENGKDEDGEEKEERKKRERRETLPQDVRAAKYETGLRDRDDDLDPVEPLLVSLSNFISCVVSNLIVSNLIVSNSSIVDTLCCH